MDLFVEQKRESLIFNKAFIIGALAAAAALAVLIWYLAQRPSMEQQKAELLAGALREGSPEFAALSKDIIISTDPKTAQSPNAFGSISMYIFGNIRNKGEKTIDVLEVNVAVITQTNDVLKEKRVLVVPVQQPLLGPNQTIPASLEIAGFSSSDDRANIRWKVTAIRVRN